MELEPSHSLPVDPRLGGTRGQILARLRRGDSTVAELAVAVGLTRNGVRQHLAALERDRLVEPRGRERGVSKPSRRYGLSPAGRSVFAQGHGAVLRALLDELGALERDDARRILDRAGRRLARGRVADGATFAERIAAVRRAFEDLGGAPVVEDEAGVTHVRMHHCPLGDVTAAHPETCAFAQGVVSALADAPVRERCVHGERPSCAFDVTRDATDGDERD
jgi:predicted ArsR family transcriptional regulator